MLPGRWSCAVAAAVLAHCSGIFWHSPDLIKFGGVPVDFLILGGSARASSRGQPARCPLSYFVRAARPGGAHALRKPSCWLAEWPWCSATGISPSGLASTFALLQVALMAMAAGAAERVYHSAWFEASADVDTSIRLAAATLALFLINTAPMAKWTRDDRARNVRGSVAVAHPSGRCRITWQEPESPAASAARRTMSAGRPCCSPDRWST